MKPEIHLYDFFFEKAIAKKFQDLFSFSDIAFVELRQESLSTIRKLIISILVKNLHWKEKDIKTKLKIKKERVFILFVKMKQKEFQFEIDCAKQKIKVLK